MVLFYLQKVKPSIITPYIHRSAWQHVIERGSRAMTLTLSNEDPRCAVLDEFRTIPLKATQYTVAFKDEFQPVLDSHRIPYFESGRL